MTIESNSRLAGPFTCNGALVAFPFTFKVFTASDLRVIWLDDTSTENDLILSTDYTVTLNPDQDNSPGGTVTTTTAYPTGTFITITTGLPYHQNLKLSNPGGFYPDAINDALDNVVILIQQLKEIVDRSAFLPLSGIGSLNADSLVFGVNSLGTAVELRSLLDLASSTVLATPYSLAFFDDENAAQARTTLEIDYVPTTFIKTLLDDVDAATARQTLGLVLGVAAGNILQLNGSAQIPAVDGSLVTFPKKVVDTDYFETGVFATGTNAIPADNSIPQITEGDQYMALPPYTPADAANILEIEVVFFGAENANTSDNLIVALFKDSDLDAIACGSDPQTHINGLPGQVVLKHRQTAGSTSAQTFTVRAGLNTATQLNFNGGSGGAKLGGKFASSIKITEYLP